MIPIELDDKPSKNKNFKKVEIIIAHKEIIPPFKVNEDQLPDTPNKKEPIPLKETQIKNLSYEDLMALGNKFIDAEERKAEERIEALKQASSKKSSGNPALEVLGQGLKNYSKISAFASEVSEYIDVPTNLDRVNKSGESLLIYKRKNIKSKNWEISRVKGDRYQRALIYDAVSRLPTNAYSLKFINESEYENIFITLKYKVSRSPPNSYDQSNIKVERNNIEITIKLPDSEYNENWSVLMANPTYGLFLGVNLIGAISAGSELISPTNFHKDFDIQTLKRSPAFIKEIRNPLTGK